MSVSTVSPLAAPRIQTLREASGGSLLVADFTGLVFPFPARLINLKGCSRAIDSVNIGQFQSSPPIVRLSISAHDAQALKEISFLADNGKLSLSWLNPQAKADRYPKELGANKLTVTSLPAARTANLDNDRLPQYAPNLHLRSPQENSYIDRPGLKLVFTTEDLPPRGRSANSYKMEPKSSSTRLDNIGQSRADSQKDPSKALSDGRPSMQYSKLDQGQNSGLLKAEDLATFADAGGSVLPDPQINIVGGKTPTITVKSKNRLTFKSFRLREPERFVVDFEGIPELEKSQLPDLEQNAAIRAVRVGARHDRQPSGRLVCDLTSDTIVVDAKLNEDETEVTLFFRKEVARRAEPIQPGVSVVLDAGHGGSDPGAQRGAAREKEMTLPIVFELKRLLEGRGMRVTMTRSDDSFVSLEDRVRITNTVQPTLFLSVHINSMPVDSDLHGIETYYQTPQSRFLADCVHESLVNHLDDIDRAVRKARFYVINHTEVPAILAEVGFISCREEREKLISSEYQKQIAKALEHGVILYLANQYELAHNDGASLRKWSQKRFDVEPPKAPNRVVEVGDDQENNSLAQSQTASLRGIK